jgi:hypothetical protein
MKGGQRGGMKLNQFLTQKKSPFTRSNMTINASQNALTRLSNAELTAKFNAAMKGMLGNIQSRTKEKEFQKYLKERERRSKATLAQANVNLRAAVNQANANAMAGFGLG